MLVEKRSKSEFCFPLSHLPPRLSHKTCQSHTHTHTHPTLKVSMAIIPKFYGKVEEGITLH